MSDEQTAATRYRQRAEELRSIADATLPKQQQEALRKIAEDYDRMADMLEGIDANRRTTRGGGPAD